MDITAIGDLHGDYENTCALLIHMNIIDKCDQPKWIAHNRTLIQTGDILDRGRDGIKIIRLFQTLKKQASMVNGTVIHLLGNHELLNLFNKFKYVNRHELDDEYKKLFKRPTCNASQNFQSSGTFNVLSEQTLTESAGEMFLYLSTLDSAIILDGTLFVHAGILQQFAKRGLKSINDEVRLCIRFGVQNLKKEGKYKSNVVGPDGPLWTRFFARNVENVICSELEKILNLVNAKRMVIGHTVHEKITFKCNEKLILIDVGISRAYKGRLSAIRIINGDVKVVNIDPSSLKN